MTEVRTIAHGFARGDRSGRNPKLTSGKWHRPIPSTDMFGRHYACGWNSGDETVWQAVFEGFRPDEPYCKKCWPKPSI